MLLHNSNINVAIAVILIYQESLYDLQGPKYKNPNLRMNKKWARSIFRYFSTSKSLEKCVSHQWHLVEYDNVEKPFEGVSFDFPKLFQTFTIPLNFARSGPKFNLSNFCIHLDTHVNKLLPVSSWPTRGIVSPKTKVEDPTQWEDPENWPRPFFLFCARLNFVSQPLKVVETFLI